MGVLDGVVIVERDGGLGCHVNLGHPIVTSGNSGA